MREKLLLIMLGFFYPCRKETQVLKNFCMELKPGRVHALVGPSGGGVSIFFLVGLVGWLFVLVLVLVFVLFWFIWGLIFYFRCYF